MSPNNAYLRFFSLSRTAAEHEARRVTREPDLDHAALLALYGGEVVGLASYEVERGSGGKTAEVAFAVADTMHQRGIATLLLEHLVSLARARQVDAFVAETLSENIGMLRVFSDAGLPVSTRREEGVVTITIPLPPDDTGLQFDAYLDTVAARERAANVASLRPVFQPGSVAVIGASRRPGTVGRSVLENIKSGGYAGRLYAVNPNTTEIAGVPSFPDVPSLPEAPDLALLAVPPAEVIDAAEACGRLGARGLVVFAAAVDATAGAGLLAVCRRYGMRLIGPNCFGIAVPSIGLDATFAAANPAPGTAGLVMQSGGLGFALVDHLTRLGIGISSFASVGNKLDVSSNDMLMWWERDGQTRVAVLYIESFGNPRKFARTARRVGARIPVITVHAGRSEAGPAGGRDPYLVHRHPAGHQGGAVRAGRDHRHPQLRRADGGDGAARHPAAAGRAHGRDRVQRRRRGRARGRRLHRPRAHGSPPARPNQAAAGRPDPRRRLRQRAGGHGRDGLGRRLPPGARGARGRRGGARDHRAGAAHRRDRRPALGHRGRRSRPDAGGGGAQPAGGRPHAQHPARQGPRLRLPGGGRPGARPRRPVRAVARRAAPVVPALADVDAERGRELVHGFLAALPGGGWLPEAEVVALLGHYGLSLAPAATARPGDDEVVIGVKDDQMFGPLVVLGPAGPSASGSVYAARLAPLTGADADTLIDSIRSGSATQDLSGAPVDRPAGDAALRETLLRVSRLTDDLPEIAELDLSPVIAGQDGAVVVDARIRVAPPLPQDPFLRKLRLRQAPFIWRSVSMSRRPG